MTVIEKRDLIAMIDRWLACNKGRVPTEAENERRKCAKELNRWLRHEDRSPPASEEGAGRGRAYESLLRVAEKYAAFCWQAGVEADASSLDPAEQLHAQALAAIQRAKVSR